MILACRVERRSAPVERSRPKAGGAVSRPTGGNHALLHQQAGQDGRLHRSHGVLLQGFGCAPDAFTFTPSHTHIVLVAVHPFIPLIHVFWSSGFIFSSPCSCLGCSRVLFLFPVPHQGHARRCVARLKGEVRPEGGHRAGGGHREASTGYVHAHTHTCHTHPLVLHNFSRVKCTLHLNVLMRPITHADSCDDGNSSGSLYASLEQSNSKKYAPSSTLAASLFPPIHRRMNE